MCVYIIKHTYEYIVSVRNIFIPFAIENSSINPTIHYKKSLLY